MWVDTSGLECPYCNEVPEPRGYEADDPYQGEWHECVVMGLMVRFIPEGHKREHPDKPKKKPPKYVVEEEPTGRSVRKLMSSVSYLDTPGAFNPALGGPTRGRR